MPDENLKFLQEEAKRLTDENRDLRVALSALQESVRALSELYLIAQEVDSDTNVVRLLTGILDSALEVLKASDGSLLLIDEETGELVFTVVRGEKSEELVGYRLAKGQGLAGWVTDNRQPQIVLDVRRDPRFFASIDEAFHFKTRSMVCVPVYLDESRVMGVIEVLNKVSDREFTQDDLNLMLVVAQLAAVAIHRAERAITPPKDHRAKTTRSRKKRSP
jgi:sigma-B regulation protein RsbU (phosphoserine phosphatase)